MHELSSSFILAYRGCDRSVAERLLDNKPFKISENQYDWLGSGVYFWDGATGQESTCRYVRHSANDRARVARFRAIFNNSLAVVA